MRKSLMVAATTFALVAGATSPVHAAETAGKTETADNTSSTNTQTVFQAWADGWTAIDTPNPIDWLKIDAEGIAMMSSGDVETSAQSSAQSTSVWLLIVGLWMVFGQLAQIIMSAVNR